MPKAKQDKADSTPVWAGIKDRPLIVVSGIVVTAITVTVGVIGYFSQQRVDRLNESHQAAVERITQNHRIELSNRERTLQSEAETREKRLRDDLSARDVTVRDLQNSLASIRRGTNGGDRLDIRTLFLEGNTTPADSTYVASIRAFVRTADDARFIQRQTNESEYMSQLMGGLFAETVPRQVQDALRQSIISLWEAPQSTHYTIQNSVFARMYPHIAVQRMSWDRISSMVSSIESGFRASDVGAFASVDVTDTPMSSADRRRQFAEALQNSDLTRLRRFVRTGANMLFLSALMQAMSMMNSGLVEHVSARIIDIQTSGNVLYGSFSLTFDGSQISRTDSTAVNTLNVFKEIFLIADPEELIIVNSYVTSETPRPEPVWAANITAWLSGLRFIAR